MDLDRRQPLQKHEVRSPFCHWTISYKATSSALAFTTITSFTSALLFRQTYIQSFTRLPCQNIIAFTRHFVTLQSHMIQAMGIHVKDNTVPRLGNMADKRNKLSSSAVSQRKFSGMETVVSGRISLGQQSQWCREQDGILWLTICLARFGSFYAQAERQLTALCRDEKALYSVILAHSATGIKMDNSQREYSYSWPPACACFISTHVHSGVP